MSHRFFTVIKLGYISENNINLVLHMGYFQCASRRKRKEEKRGVRKGKIEKGRKRLGKGRNK